MDTPLLGGAGSDSDPKLYNELFIQGNADGSQYVFHFFSRPEQMKDSSLSRRNIPSENK